MLHMAEWDPILSNIQQLDKTEVQLDALEQHGLGPGGLAAQTSDLRGPCTAEWAGEGYICRGQDWGGGGGGVHGGGR